MFRVTISALLASVAIMGASSAFAETFEVQMLNKSEEGFMVFEPSAIRINAGDSVKFLATDKSHNAESIEGSHPVGTEPFKGKINEEIEVTFEEEGYYAIICLPHFAMGMVMIVAVGGGTEPQEGFLDTRIPPTAKERFAAQLEALATMENADAAEGTEAAQ